MKEYHQTLSIDQKTLLNSLNALDPALPSVCFFDIETTGLSPHVSSVYLIGAAWYDGSSMQLIQWFADDYTSEENILCAFADFLRSFDCVVHYNGTTFDIPYLEKKYLAHKLPSPFQSIRSLDLLKDIRKLKSLFLTPNQKLTTMEQLLGFSRNDTFTGKDCIQLYQNFMQKKVFRDESHKQDLALLLLHNHDDLIGTILCCQFLYYSTYRPNHPFCERDATSWTVEDSINGYFPIPITNEKPPFTISFNNQTIRICVLLHAGILRHFFADYKNYYYLPVEDEAIHKSVGIYVDPTRRQKATASNCYIKKTGTFLPLPDKHTAASLPHFQEEKKSPIHYLYLTDTTTLPPKDLKEYIGQVLLYQPS